MTAGAQRQVPKSDELESLFSRYTDLAREVVLKEDLLCEGVSFADGSYPEGHSLRRSLLLDSGRFKLFRTIVRPWVRGESPYVVRSDPEDGGYLLLDRAERTLAHIRPYPVEPAYASRTLPDGTSYGDAVPPDGHIVLQGPPADPRTVAEVAFDAFVMEKWPPQEGPLNLTLDGNLLGHLDPVARSDLCLRYVDALVDRLYHCWTICLQTAPLDTDAEQRLKRRGVDVRIADMDVWDRDLFGVLCADKAGQMSWDDWLQYYVDLPYVFGEGASLAGFLVGAEMSRFTSISDAVRSTGEGFDFLLGHGVIPRPVHWQGDASGLIPEGPQPPLEYFLEIDRKWYELWYKHQGPEPNSGILGVGRNRFPYSAAYDVGRGGPPEYAPQWDAEAFGQPGHRIPAGAEAPPAPFSRDV